RRISQQNSNTARREMYGSPVLKPLIVSKVDDELNLEVFEISPHAVTYCCISHVWGDVERHTAGSRSMLASSKHKCEAVRKAIERSMDPVWIDILSIDQKDRAKKQTLIDDMMGIYQAARKVIVVLEPSCSDDFADLEKIFSRLLTDGGPVGLEESQIINSLMKESLVKLSKMPYYCRLWTLVEQLVAQELRYQNYEGDEAVDLVKLALNGLKFLSRSVARQQSSQWVKMLMFRLCNAKLSFVVGALADEIVRDDRNEEADKGRIATMSFHKEWDAILSELLFMVMENSPLEFFRSKITDVLSRIVVTPSDTRYMAHPSIEIVSSSVNLSYFTISALRSSLRSASLPHDFCLSVSPLFGLKYTADYEADADRMFYQFHSELIARGIASPVRRPCNGTLCNSPSWSGSPNCNSCVSSGLLMMIFDSPEKYVASTPRFMGLSLNKRESELKILAYSTKEFVTTGICVEPGWQTSDQYVSTTEAKKEHIQTLISMAQLLEDYRQKNSNFSIKTVNIVGLPPVKTWPELEGDAPKIHEHVLFLRVYASALSRQEVTSTADRLKINSIIENEVPAELIVRAKAYYWVFRSLMNFYRKSFSTDITKRVELLSNHERDIIIFVPAELPIPTNTRFRLLQTGARASLIWYGNNELGNGNRRVTSSLWQTYILHLPANLVNGGSNTNAINLLLDTEADDHYEDQAGYGLFGNVTEEVIGKAKRYITRET
ncbi:hypothetical protein HK096_005878, partial [Nowakowskiella sp. JEL0078]